LGKAKVNERGMRMEERKTEMNKRIIIKEQGKVDVNK